LDLAANHETGEKPTLYAEGDSCMIFGLNTPIVNPYNTSATAHNLESVEDDQADNEISCPSSCIKTGESLSKI
jgi:hypothetical protein